MQRRQQSGFTLIEIMVVVVILGILAALVVPQVMSRPDQAKVTVAKGDIKAIAAALDMYKLDNFAYPSTQQGLEALVKKPHRQSAAEELEQGRLPEEAAGRSVGQSLPVPGAGHQGPVRPVFAGRRRQGRRQRQRRRHR
ncbi:general secretion pathway protein G [Pseudomonas aeruginosa]|nr:general secretion pathway protein G [Pseudomonas aeruginosa]